MNAKIKNVRMLSLWAIALALVIGSAISFAAKAPEEQSHNGLLVSLNGNQLVMANEGSKDGQENTYTLAADGRLTLDGKDCEASALKPGIKIRVTTQGADQSVVIRIEGLDKNPEFAGSDHVGTVVSITGSKLVMTSEGGQPHSHALTADVRLTLDGKACQAVDLKPGTRIRVTTQGAGKSAAIRVEGLDKNPDFATL